MASCYGQGFSAHYAIGTFLEAGGDDKYVSRHAVAEGMSWDLGLTLFEDFAGNDRYQTCPHCLGTAAQSGLTFFIEHQGDDTYTGNFLPYDLEAVPNDYHSGVKVISIRCLYHVISASHSAAETTFVPSFKVVFRFRFLTSIYLGISSVCF